MDKDYIRSSPYPASVWAEEMRKHRLEALARLKSIQGFETA
ncbi:Uncharacterised protein [Legionella pneumophila subsp. pascullei]|uniref:Uncharacterized protein n=1 Tax=Legionella pneumophila subsp. pascullei TaxID=91890 RepID=A0AAX2J000_LEGPN|nr:hypothetical protein [Legionella pneumophila]SQG91224.1 Uncharacterised protein [Legionella pneumophila subsp. pascullei]VEH07770.1 Uncharacterised protein [Legionella pneumophila subsp. pascullei]